jgi:crotonobetainyl-CoA:carnitine CoA-transferase CaiB-like acyl-CoA transferase
MSVKATLVTRSVWSAIGGDEQTIGSVSFTGTGGLPSAYAVTDFAASAIATASLAIVELIRTSNGTTPSTVVDRRNTSLWFGMSLRPLGWQLPPPWDPIAGDYRTSDGWIRLHTNAPHHRASAERVLGAHPDRDAMARVVERWRKGELEKAIVEAGGCAAEMRTAAEWAEHAQGRAVNAEPLAHIATPDSAPIRDWPVQPSRPLRGLRVLDLTRVLAGPVATRFLAAFGADVLRIDPPGWDEPGVVPEVTLGKLCARLNLHDGGDRRTFEALLSQADIVVHSYRPEALDRLGFDSARRRGLSPGLIDVCLDAYGWSGPWASRRGFDSLVQMSTGIADAGMRWRKADRPVPLPVQALDHATGYLMAAVAIRAVTLRLKEGKGTAARLSLARTATLLQDVGTSDDRGELPPETSADVSSTVESTDWGEARRVNPPVTIEGTPMRWDHPACKLGSSAAQWR